MAHLCPMLKPCILASLLSFAALPAHACDLALALAIDVSGSVDRREYAIQTEGLAAALRDPTVAEALVSARAALMVMHWTGNGRQQIVLDWRRVSGFDALERIAEDVGAIRRTWRHYSTAIGEALTFAADSFDAAPPCKRRVIDISGDGRSNEGPAPDAIRKALAADGITVNAIAIEGSEPDLTAYFEDHVIAGRGAFVITADGYEDYPRQIRRKLIRESADRLADTR